MPTNLVYDVERLQHAWITRNPIEENIPLLSLSRATIDNAFET